MILLGLLIGPGTFALLLLYLRHEDHGLHLWADHFVAAGGVPAMAQVWWWAFTEGYRLDSSGLLSGIIVFPAIGAYGGFVAIVRLLRQLAQASVR